MRRQRLSKILIKRNSSLLVKNQSSLDSSGSEANLRKTKQRPSKFGDLGNLPEFLKQRNPNVEEVQKVQEEPVRFVYGKIQYELDRVVKHLRLIHQGIIYSTLALGSPSEEYLKQKKLFLPEEPNNQKKFLMLDLDETLIHSVEDDEKYQVEINSKTDKIRFNIRPFCEMFLDTISEHFQVYVFTSATHEYAKPIVDYLNSNKNYIKGFLTREHCLETKNGLRIKDLRIIKNRDLSQIVIVDNLVHSFGLQLENGIPILEFTKQKNDRQLLGLQKILLDLKKVQDVRVYLRQKLALKKCLELPEDDFINVKNTKNFIIKKRTSYY